MRLSTSAFLSLSKQGNKNRSGMRIRKKHKSLDAISEDVFNRNRRMGSNGGSGKVDSVGNDGLEVRRSSRVRRAPEILDSSPHPKRKKRKFERVGRDGRHMGLRGKSKMENKVGGSGFGSSEEELGSRRTRLRMKGNSSSRGKRKLFEDAEDDEKEVRSLKDDMEETESSLDGEKTGDEEDTDDDSDEPSMKLENKIKDDHSREERLANGNDNSENEEVGHSSPSTTGKADASEDIVDGDSGVLIAIEREVTENTMLEEKIDRDQHMGESSQTDKLVNSPEVVKDAQHRCQATQLDTVPNDLAKNGNNDMTKSTDAEAEIRNKELENGLKVKISKVAIGEIPRPHIREGRRCGLCGGGTDGKPPRKLVTDSGGSDHEVYSGSYASEEFSYDPWDGFGDESGWLGRLLGPVNDRHGIAGIWVHQHCAVWSPEVYFAGLGCMKNIRAALCRGRSLKCTRCGRPGATLGCRVDRCPRTYHLPCSRASGCNFDHRKFLIACADHRYLFEPHGQHYIQRMKKLKAKKMKLEIRKLSNDASRKDVEAEEKWMDKCGEDEEFLRRETKRLQRDLLRIAPIYIGGPHSEGENPIGGWESVAGLQDVVQCMKEVIILPLLYPEFFDNMGITPPRGVLLHGYPGTGKTLVVRSLIGACARGDKRIAYFARKGADCLGKYVGDAERQLRLLFQVAEKSQPSIIFFDEIDGLAPVRTRQQDQTHSSVVSTLLALMDGLKSRGSVIVIGATNRPDSIDPALRRPGRFDREIYFPLPSAKDRAAILALHTRKWPKPVSGPLLEWISNQTVGFAGADLQALCAQAAVIALKRNCSWDRVLSCAAENPAQGRRPELPSFVVEERDWVEALSLASPPCSLREAGMAANEVLGTPLDIHLIPSLLQPLLRLIISLYLDDRLWLPLCLADAGSAIKSIVISQMVEKNLESDKWPFLAQNMALDPNVAREIVRKLHVIGIVKIDASFSKFDSSKDTPNDDGVTHQCSFGKNPSGLLGNVCSSPLKKTGYRILISGAPRSGQKHLASCLLHCFVGNVENQKIDLATMSQEGHGDMEQGILRILMKCVSLKMCVVFMPRIDLWAIEPCCQSYEEDGVVSLDLNSPKASLMPRQDVLEECSPRTSELVGEPDSQNQICIVSKTWKIFREQLECLGVSSSLIILATSELSCAALPCEIRQFFGSGPLSEGPSLIQHANRRFSIEVNGELDQNKLINLSAIDLSRNLIQQFVHVAHLGNHHNPDATSAQDPFEDTGNISAHMTDLRSVEEPGVEKEPPVESAIKSQVPSGYKNMKEKSTLVTAVITFGYQILRYPHFAELCWVTSKLNEGPSADIRGPWKGWPFNSCIVRPCQLVKKDDAVCNSNNINGRDKFTLVRGLIAVGLSATRGVYKSSREVSLEVRRVLELLVGQISSRIQSGKDKCQYIRLLSQVAYLEDMVNNWSHSLRSLEPEDQTQVMTGDVISELSPEKCQTLTVEPMQVEDQPNTEDGGFQKAELVSGGMVGSTAEDSGGLDLNIPADLNTEAIDAGVDNRANFAVTGEMSAVMDVDVTIGHQRDVTITDEFSSEKVVDASVDNGIDLTITDGLSPENAVDVSVNYQRDLTITDELSPEKAVDASVDNRIDSGNTDEMPLQKGVELCGPTEFPNQSNSEPMIQNEIPAEAELHKNDVNLPDFNSSRESSEMPSKPEVLCSYACCVGCINTLQEMAKKRITQDIELSGSCTTVEDIHDLVSSLSTNLCAAVRNLYITGEVENPFHEKKISGIFDKFEPACQCGESESRPTKLMNCVYHSNKEISEESKPSSVYDDQLELKCRYVFRNGVLVSADLDQESSFHCKYDALCLSSLIELILRTKKPVE